MWIKLVDFGLVILIWLVQLVIYPSFKYYSDEDLSRWHPVYTTGITIIVMPLMLSQIALHGIRVYQEMGFLQITSLILVISTWVLTFMIFVPLHNKISIGDNLGNTINQLIGYNWIRTFIWSTTFLLGLLIKQK